MADLQRPMINGHVPDWSSCEFKFFGRIYTGVKSVNYNDDFDATEVYGTHSESYGETRGPYKASGDAELYIDEFKRLVADLGPGWREVRGLLLASYRDGEQPVTTDRIIGVRLKGIDASQSQGSDPLVRKVTLSMRKILWNGVENLKKPLTGAA